MRCDPSFGSRLRGRGGVLSIRASTSSRRRVISSREAESSEGLWRFDIAISNHTYQLAMLHFASNKPCVRPVTRYARRPIHSFIPMVRSAR
jgi:hypothetical protein